MPMNFNTAVLAVLIHADLTTEKELMEQKPSGH